MRKKVQRLSQYLEVDPFFFKENQILDPILGVDVRVFVDPQRLLLTQIPEFAEARSKIEDYFSRIFLLIAKSQTYNDPFWKRARSMLTLSEVKGVGIGFGSETDNGRALGSQLADQLLKTATFIHKHGVTDPVVFELLGLFEDNFGPDRLSDLTLSILRREFITYTVRKADEMKVEKRREYLYRGERFLLPFRKDSPTPVTLVPTDLLRSLPIGLDPDEITDAGHLKKELQDSWSSLVSEAWKKAKKDPDKETRKNLFLSHPEFFAPLIQVYRENKTPSYDFDIDPEGLLQWQSIGAASACKYPITFPNKPHDLQSLDKVVALIIGQFKKNIELNGLNKHLYDDTGVPRKELFAQLLFFASADSYCTANSLDISPESNAGKGPVDFKLSSGATKVVVEMKLSKHKQLFHGYETQVGLYEKSEGAQGSYYVLIKVNKTESIQFKEVKELAAERAQVGKGPSLVVIDGLIYPSASKKLHGHG